MYRLHAKELAKIDNDSEIEKGFQEDSQRQPNGGLLKMGHQTILNYSYLVQTVVVCLKNCN